MPEAESIRDVDSFTSPSGRHYRILKTDERDATDNPHDPPGGAAVTGQVPVHLLLRADWRTADGVRRVVQILEKLGLKPSASGSASVSVRIPPRAVKRFLGISRSRLAELAREPINQQTQTLEVPEQLKEYVESISVLPPPIHMR